MAWVRDIDSLFNFIGFVVLRAPSNFPVEDYLPADEQLNLERAFAELRRGVELIKAQAPNLSGIEKLDVVLVEALAFYRRGEDLQGAQRLHDFEALIFKS